MMFSTLVYTTFLQDKISYYKEHRASKVIRCLTPSIDFSGSQAPDDLPKVIQEAFGGTGN